MILLIDDDPELLASLHKRLALRGYAVKSAAHAEQALKACDATVKALLIDWGVQHQGKPLWQHFTNQPTPIFIMTGYDDSVADPTLLKTQGVSGVFFKPLELDDVLATLKGFGIKPNAP